MKYKHYSISGKIVILEGDPTTSFPPSFRKEENAKEQ
jgi:hypothetical protein